MPASFEPIRDYESLVLERAFPSVTVWNRLEGRPRTVEFERALRAEVRDALWMLTRQWQLGEFRGDDAGSPVSTTVQLSNTTLSSLQARDGVPVPIDDAIPLETAVEGRDVPLVTGGIRMSLDLRLLAGRRWLKQLPVVYRAMFTARYAFELPDPSDAADTDLVAQTRVHATLQALAGRALDGLRLYEHLQAAPGNRVYDGLPVAGADKPLLDAAAVEFVAFVDGLFARWDGEQAWDPARLEHRFAVTALARDGEKRFVAEEHPGGRLDWHAFSLAAGSADGGGELGDAITVVPRPAQFDGMPDSRWWAFEDGRTNLGEVRADTTDVAKLLFLEFALVYGNDWSIIPCELPLGSVARVEGLAVTNVFGERLWIEPADAGGSPRWAMYRIDREGSSALDLSLLLLGTLAGGGGQGHPVESVALVRDEMANMVWGIERTVPLATGDTRRGSEVAGEGLAHRRVLGEATPAVEPPPAAPIAYRAMLMPPEHWIPFVPVHVAGDSRETQLQRAALPRIIEGSSVPIERVRPRTTLLREGLDVTPARSYLVHEEEVPREGTNVALAFQRARWRDGSAVVWLSARRGTGHGEGSSGLAFDQLTETGGGAP